MNLEHLRAFLEVASTGNFNRAAERLNVTQSTVSARIQALESQLDERLFDREHGGVRLTAAGQRIYRYVELSLRAWHQARQEVALPDALSYRLGLGVHFNLFDRVVPVWLAWMRANSSETAIRVEADFSQSLTQQVADGLLDLALVYEPRSLPSVASEILIDHRVVLVSTVPRTARQGWVEDYVLVDWGDDFRSWHSRAFPNMPAPTITVGFSAMGLEYILEHGGSGYFLDYSVRPLIEEGRLHRVKGAPTYTRSVYVVRALDSPQAGLVDWALKGLQGSLDLRRMAKAS